MRKIFIKSLNKLIELNDTIIQIKIESPIIYRKLIYSFSDDVIYSENNKPLDLSRKLFVISDFFNTNLNDKKILQNLYKKLSQNITLVTREKISLIETNINDMIEELTINLDFPLTYLDQLDITKLFSIYQLSFKPIEFENYLENIVNYIKIIIELNEYNLLLSYGFINTLTIEEQKMLAKELSILGVTLIDLSLQNFPKEISYLTIDDDWFIM